MSSSKNDVARPPTIGRRATRYVGRHRVALSLVAVGILAVVVGYLLATENTRRLAVREDMKVIIAA